MPKVEMPIEMENGREITFTVTYDAMYQRGYTTGLPEDCYPPESDLDIESIEPDIAVVPYSPEHIAELLDSPVILEKIEDACWDHYFDLMHE